mmetsp:Transcript_28581/g.57545  ORF Transcript_28581/g.57545 Transcript_28581/m.57545 type:complete len:170 (-) Transcript_28581:280-789(-)
MAQGVCEEPPTALVHPVVSFNEKDLARMESVGLRIACAEDNAGENESSPLVPVRAQLYSGEEQQELTRDFASGQVPQLPASTRFHRWIRKKMGFKVSETEFLAVDDPEEANRIVREARGKKGWCALCLAVVNGTSAVMVVVSMLVLALLLLVYYFRSEFSSSYSGAGSA